MSTINSMRSSVQNFEGSSSELSYTSAGNNYDNIDGGGDGPISEDRGPAWKLHDKLYGRGDESKIIHDLTDERSTNVLVLKGHAGSGKSTLIESQPWHEQGWIFASGKYEQHRTNVPYSALIDALDDLCNQWAVNNSTASICQLDSFHRLLEQDIVFLRNILPKAFQMAGCKDRNREAQLKKLNNKKRIAEGGFGSAVALEQAALGTEYVNAAFWRILSFLCEARPVVLFLDDLQWADQASLDAIHVLATAGKVEGLLLVLAYRDEEVQEGHPVLQSLQVIRDNLDENVNMQEIHVTDLDVDNVNKLVASVLARDAKITLPLSRVVHTKTNGNPFFVIQFLVMLRRERFIQFNMINYHWEWGDVDKIGQLANVSDNVADIIAATIAKLPVATRFTLKTASALGKVIPLQIMVEFFDTIEGGLDGKSKTILCEALKGIETKGLKKVLDEAVVCGVLNRSDDHEIYMWAHDKLQHVAYSMIPDSFRPRMHSTLGNLLWKKSSENPGDEWMLYMAADQLNRVAELSDEVVCRDIALLSLEAGKLSLSKSALFPALDMIRAAKTHADRCRNGWTDCYDLMLDIYSTLAEVTVRIGSCEEAEELAAETLCHAKTLDDKYRAQIVMTECVVSGSNRDYSKGLDVLLEVLHDYGIKLPSKLLPGQLFLEIRKVRSQLGGNVERFLSLPRVDETTQKGRRTRHIVTMLSNAAVFSWVVHSKRSIGFYAAMRAANLSIKEGVCPETATAIACAAMHVRLDGHYKDALELGEFAIKLVDSFPQELGSPHAKVRVSVVAGVYSSSLPFNNLLDPFLEINRIGLKVGDTEKAAMGFVGYSFAYLAIGLPLAPLQSDLISFGKEARQFGMADTVQVMFPIIRQFIQNLQVRQPNPTILKNVLFDQEKELLKFHGPGLKMTERDANTFRLVMACIYRDWNEAASLVDALESILEKDKFVVRGHLRITYMGIASIVLGKEVSNRKHHHFEKLGKRIIKMLKSDVKKGNPNAHPVLLMLEAIQTPSKENFDEAIRSCARLGLIHHEALIFENASLYYLKKNDEGWAEYYMAQAYGLYRDWGATGKTDKLMEDHHELLRSSSLSATASGSNLKGRSRYIPEYSQRVKELNLSKLSINSGSSRPSLTEED